ncbi:disease resistance protein RPV1-like [Prosopis cineraria]|uniref:disease resistance protein RPV1-like n=1 Tax=Prosopis cineraria TaxID=364024 RepID=UPI00240F1BFC|nr:disease resistance protein RPV1-like [Prosopis cineraria]
MAFGTASSSSSSLPPKKHDVFLSFRGEDTRRTFASHLYAALRQRGIRTYIDYELPKGNDISDALIQAIQDSGIAVVIFSENYASSKWCLNELVQILWCGEVQGQLVIPVFYQIDPSHVRNYQKGIYMEAFTKHERDLKLNQYQVNKWKQALSITANLAGWDSRACRDESELIQNIISHVMQNISVRCPSSLAVVGLVGIDENCAKIERLLEKDPKIGIWGMGGIGKTTMARALFSKLSSQFERSCFLENLRENVKKCGLTYLHDKLFSELWKQESSYNRPLYVDEGSYVMHILSRNKVFMVLDDISNRKQLEYLAPYCNYLEPGSKIIITTRHKQLLNIAGVKIYEAQPLSDHKSIELFNLKAFNTYHPKIGYEFLSKRVVDYAKGIPLVLVVLASFLSLKTPKEWDNALSKLKKGPHEEILEVLKLSFDGLDYEEKEMFLDIACFLKDEHKEHVIALFESYGFDATIGLTALEDKALVNIDNNMRVQMHDLIQAMGWKIVRQECMEDPGRRSRLWNPYEIYDVLKYNRGTNAIKGIIVNLSQVRDMHLSANTFKKMTNLRFLKLYSPTSRGESSCIIDKGPNLFPSSLRYLRWDNFLMKSLPLSFCVEKLVEICMPGSRLEKLWDGVQDLVNLRKIDFSGSKQLIELPDFSKAKNLEVADLSLCESLCHLHPSIWTLRNFTG